MTDVRIAGDGDLLAMLRVLAQGGDDREPPDAPTERETAAWARMMATPDLRVYVGEVDGEIVGTATSLRLPHVTHDCAPTVFIEAVVVATAHRRRGVASAVISRLMADARDDGCDKVQLLSHKRHATDGAHALYTSLGFEAMAEGFRHYFLTGPRGG